MSKIIYVPMARRPADIPKEDLEQLKREALSSIRHATSSTNLLTRQGKPVTVDVQIETDFEHSSAFFNAVASRREVGRYRIRIPDHAWRERGICGLMGAHNGGRHALLTEAQIAVALEIARAEALSLGGIAQRVEAALNEPLPCKIETLGEALKRNGFSFKRNRYALKKSATKKRSP